MRYYQHHIISSFTSIIVTPTFIVIITSLSWLLCYCHHHIISGSSSVLRELSLQALLQQEGFCTVSNILAVLYFSTLISTTPFICKCRLFCNQQGGFCTVSVCTTTTIYCTLKYFCSTKLTLLYRIAPSLTQSSLCCTQCPLQILRIIPSSSQRNNGHNTMQCSFTAMKENQRNAMQYYET